MKVKEIYNLINDFAPFETQMDFDNAGLLIGDMESEITSAAVALDASLYTLNKTAQLGANLLITHHPVIFNPLKSVSENSPVYFAIKKGINIISAHTNADSAVGGVNDLLAQKIGLSNVTPFADGLPRMGKGEFENVKSLAKHLKEVLSCDSVKCTDCGKKITKIALCGGSGGDYISSAIENGCDALVVGEAKHNHRIEAKDKKIILIECGHYNTEKYIKNVFNKILTDAGLTSVIIEESDPANYI